MVVIDRDKWMRGDGGDKSCLRDGKGKMCCLGFLGLACGFTSRQLSDAVAPSELPSRDDSLKNDRGDDELGFDVDYAAGSGKWPTKIARVAWATESDLANHLICVNDTKLKGPGSAGAVRRSRDRKFYVPDEVARERIIAELMAEAGVDVTFVGGDA